MDQRTCYNGNAAPSGAGDATLLGPYRVLDLAGEQGALCGKLLASMGADVIRVEPPRGCELRRRGPFHRGVPHTEGSLAWWALGANKRGITLDIETKEGRSILLRLAEKADFLIESFEPDYLGRHGLGFEELNKINPALVVVSVTPYGQTGPHSHWAASDINIQAMGTHMALTGDADRAPIRVGLPAAYWHGGSEAVEAALIAHHYRRRTGRGQHVDVSMQQCIIWCLLNTTMTVQLTGRQEMRGGAMRKERGNPVFTRSVWPCKDGLVQFIPIGGGGGKSRSDSYHRFMAWMKAEGFYEQFLDAKDWNHRDMYSYNQEEYDRVAKRIGEFLLTRTLDELYSRSVSERLLLAPISSVKDLLDSPQLRARDFFVDVNHPTLGQSFQYPGAFAKFSRTPLVPPRPAPRLGEHNDEVYRDILGMSTDRLAGLRSAGVI